MTYEEYRSGMTSVNDILRDFNIDPSYVRRLVVRKFSYQSIITSLKVFHMSQQTSQACVILIPISSHGTFVCTLSLSQPAFTRPEEFHSNHPCNGGCLLCRKRTRAYVSSFPNLKHVEQRAQRDFSVGLDGERMKVLVLYG
jgi:hypothetical protein